MCCFILYNSVLSHAKALVLICASQNYKKVLLITALILAALFWKIQFLFYSGIWDAYSISVLSGQKS